MGGAFRELARLSFKFTKKIVYKPLSDKVPLVFLSSIVRMRLVFLVLRLLKTLEVLVWGYVRMIFGR